MAHLDSRTGAEQRVAREVNEPWCADKESGIPTSSDE